MKLYYSRGACSLAAHIVAREAGLPFALVSVDLETHTLADGSDYGSIAPRNHVPVLELDTGERISEVGVILQYLAETAGNTDLLPPPKTMARVRVQEWLNFTATELHKVFSPWLWHKDTAPSTQEAAHRTIFKRFDELEELLSRQPYLTGEIFTVADAYAFTMMMWANFLHLDMSAYPHLKRYSTRISTRPQVAEALKAEHLKSPKA